MAENTLIGYEIDPTCSFCREADRIIKARGLIIDGLDKENKQVKEDNHLLVKNYNKLLKYIAYSECPPSKDDSLCEYKDNNQISECISCWEKWIEGDSIDW